MVDVQVKQETWIKYDCSLLYVGFLLGLMFNLKMESTFSSKTVADFARLHIISQYTELSLLHYFK
jgi:hypothetical protein